MVNGKQKDAPLTLNFGLVSRCGSPKPLPASASKITQTYSSKQISKNTTIKLDTRI